MVLFTQLIYATIYSEQQKLKVKSQTVITVGCEAPGNEIIKSESRMKAVIQHTLTVSKMSVKLKQGTGPYR